MITRLVCAFLMSLEGLLFSFTRRVTPRASLVTQLLKNLPVMQETWIPSVGRKDPLEKEMATHPSILAWKIPWTEEPDGLKSMGSQELDMTQPLNHHQQRVKSTFCDEELFFFKLFLLKYFIDMKG